MSIKWLVAASLLLFAGTATAGVYIGGEVNSTDVSANFEDIADNFSDRALGWGAVVGYEWDNFGVEASWISPDEFEDAEVAVDTDGWTISGIGKIPLSEKWSVVAKAGYFDFSADVDELSSGTSESLSGESGILFGGGVNWEFVESFNIRALATLYDADGGSINQVNLGLLYEF